MKRPIKPTIYKYSPVFLLMTLLLFSFSNNKNDNEPKPKRATNEPVFLSATYKGEDEVYKKYPLKDGEFYNPILQGTYPDPAITRKGDDYYMVCSSFAMFPGVPIFHSNDLVNWTQIGHVLDRTSQLDVHDTGISQGVYAPGITYNENNDTFYMITTAFAGGLGNIVVKTKDPMKGWSEPYKLKFDGIDPSIFSGDRSATRSGTDHDAGHRHRDARHRSEERRVGKD